MFVVVPDDDTVFSRRNTMVVTPRVRGWNCELQVRLPDVFGKEKPDNFLSFFYKPIKITENDKKCSTPQLLTKV